MVGSRRSASRLRFPKLGPAALTRRLFERVPELHSIARCTVDVFSNKDSSEFGFTDWQGLADRIRKQGRGYRGVVVLHGTDTLAYTASALHYLLRGFSRPVVITGAQRPLESLRNDARQNLITAVEVAAQAPGASTSRAKVLVAFGDQVYLGVGVRKRSSTEFRAFESPRTPVLAEIGSSILYHPEFFSRHGSLAGGARVRLRGSTGEVLALTGTPGFAGKLFTEDFFALRPAVVLTVYASGTGPTRHPEFLEFLREIKRRKLPLVLVTERSGWSVDPKTYPAARALFEADAIWATEMTPECAYVKSVLVSHVLGRDRNATRFRKTWNQLK